MRAMEMAKAGGFGAFGGRSDSYWLLAHIGAIEFRPTVSGAATSPGTATGAGYPGRTLGRATATTVSVDALGSSVKTGPRK